jgi:hypothetical protein
MIKRPKVAFCYFGFLLSLILFVAGFAFVRPTFKMGLTMKSVETHRKGSS